MMAREGSIERPDLEQFSNIPMFNTKAVVQQTGVSAATLRAWERRYNLLSPERAENTYRLYSERDIVVIRWLKERVDAGMAISQAIALFKHKNETEDASVDATPAFHVALPYNEPSEDIGKKSSELRFEHWPEIGANIGENVADNYPHYLATYNMHIAADRLIEAFNRLDEPTANMVMGSMLAVYSVEQVCVELIAPTLWHIGQLWADKKLTVSVEHFASNFFRALLTNMFHVAPSPSSGPMAIVCCAPGEPHEIAPLMLALFLRRRGARVVYLGQSIESAGLMHTIKKLLPGLVCVSLTMPTYLSAVIDLGSQLAELPLPRPIFAFGGQVFAHYANIIPQIPGLYLAGDLHVIAEQLYTMLNGRTDNSN